jgi:chromosome segregation ATPase
MSEHQSEVAPRSSGGAPTDLESEALLKEWAIESMLGQPRHLARRRETVLKLFAERDELRTQVSALRQEAAGLRFELHEAMGIVREQDAKDTLLTAEVHAARQEAETLTRQRDAAIREISVIAREAETLRKQLGEAVQAADDANQEEAFVRRALDSQALDYEALSREAETLRGQLETLTDDFAQAEESRRVNSALYERALRERDDARSKRDAAVATLQTIGAAGAVCPTHGKAVLVTHVDDDQPCSDYLVAARVAASREPK